MEVTIGGVNGTITWISDDGLRVNFTTPKYADVCNASASCNNTTDTEDLGYQHMQLANPRSVSRTIDTAGGTVMCPPHCAADVAASGAVYYTPGCMGYDIGPICTNRSLNALFAYGQRDDCQPCPEGGICPGGYRLWS